jgi:hypothetical protein
LTSRPGNEPEEEEEEEEEEKEKEKEKEESENENSVRPDVASPYIRWFRTVNSVRPDVASPYIRWFRTVRDQIMRDFPAYTFEEIGRHAGAEWKKMSKAEREPWVKEAKQEREQQRANQQEEKQNQKPEEGQNKERVPDPRLSGPTPAAVSCKSTSDNAQTLSLPSVASRTRAAMARQPVAFRTRSLSETNTYVSLATDAEVRAVLASLPGDTNHEGRARQLHKALLEQNLSAPKPPFEYVLEEEDERAALALETQNKLVS